MKKFACTLSYDGSPFCGWQKQRGAAAEGLPSIQETVEKSLGKITSEFPSVVASGRTDSGVHALAQVAHFSLESDRWDSQTLMNGLNSLLPTSIRITDVREVASEFHAQRSAKKKQYSYYFQQGPAPLPHLMPYTWWIRRPLDVEKMSKGIAALIGENDFKPFQASGANVGSTVRQILEAEVVRENLGLPFGFGPGNVELVRLRIIGTGFLKQMVRGIAGTALQIGEGRRPSSAFAEILSAQDRKMVGPTAPARALWLEKVWYKCVSP